jgi:hypothetical protein
MHGRANAVAASGVQWSRSSERRRQAGTDGQGGRDAEELRVVVTALHGRASVTAAATTWGGGVGDGMRKTRKGKCIGAKTGWKEEKEFTDFLIRLCLSVARSLTNISRRRHVCPVRLCSSIQPRHQRT